MCYNIVCKGIVIRRSEARLRADTLVQVLLEKPNSVPLRLLKRSLLCGIVGVTARSKAVLNAGEVDVLPRNVQLRQLFKGVLLKLLSVCEVILWRKDLDGDLGGIDLGLIDQRGVGHGDGVDKLRISTELEACPSAIAITDRDDLLVLLLQGLSVLLDLGPADVLAVAADEGHQVEALSLLWVGQRVRVDDLAFEAMIC